MTEQSLAASPSVQTAWALPEQFVLVQHVPQSRHISFVRGLPKNVESFSAISSSNTASEMCFEHSLLAGALF
jgi:hypothetical protein